MMAKVVLVTVTLGVASAAPQLFDSEQRGRQQGEIVSSVISSLQPAIAQAVQAALSAGFTSPQPAAPSVPSSDTRAQYDFEYKIANDKTQTYISQQESRDGNLVTGTYSYVV